MIQHEQGVVTGDRLTTTSIPRRGDGEFGLLDCLRAFVRYPSPQVLAGALALATAAHFAFGRWEWQDAAASLLLLCFQPFSEWLIHFGLLHSKPRRVGRFTVDLPTAKLHRWHHRHPTVIDAVLIPGPLVATFL